MDRRDFLRAGAVAGGSLGLGAMGCGAVMDGMTAVPVPSVADLAALDMDGFLKSLDVSLGFIQSSSTLDSIVPKDVQIGARKDPRFAHAEELVRKTLRSLLLTGSFNDLPEEGRAHPGMQARLWSSLREMDDAVLGMNSMLASLAPTERSDITRFMRDEPTMAPRILEALDDEAVKAGVNEKRRNHLRDVGKHACFRMRQSTSLLIDDYDDKVKKVSARDNSVTGFERRLMAQMGEEAFWQLHRRTFALAQAWQQVPGIAQAAPGAAPSGTGAPPLGTLPPGDPGAPPVATATAPGAPFPPPASSVYPTPTPYIDTYDDLDENGRNRKKLRKGTILLGVGGGMLGLGAIAAGIAAALVGNSSTQVGGWFAITAAAVLGAAGIACLIAGGVIRARA